MGALSEFLNMEPFTLGAAAKGLRRGPPCAGRDPDAGHTRGLQSTSEGAAAMRRSVGTWRRSHARLETQLRPDLARALRDGTAEIATLAPSAATTAQGAAYESLHPVAARRLGPQIA